MLAPAVDLVAKHTMVTDALGFRLKVAICVGPFATAGRHVTHENEKGEVLPDEEHRIEVQDGLDDAYLVEVASHEVYHLFYSVRCLITVDEETECEVFGQLVKHVHAVARSAAAAAA